MRIAVLVPAFNAERYLRTCLDSVLAAGNNLADSSGGIHSLDVFACDDGSTDTTRSILTEYSIRYANVHVLSQENAGVVMTRNRLLNALTPDFEAFGFVDSDDVIAPETYAELASAMCRANADVSECGMPGNAVATETILTDMTPFVLRKTAPGAWINVVNKLYRRAAVASIRFREGLSFEEDFFFNCEVHAVIGRKVVLPRVFYSYRDNPHSATHALDHRRYFESTARRVRLSLETFLAAGRVPKGLEAAWRAELSEDAFRMCIRKNLKKNGDAALRRALFAEAGDFFAGLERDFGFVPSGLNVVRRAVLRACRTRRYGFARALAALT